MASGKGGGLGSVGRVPRTRKGVKRRREGEGARACGIGFGGEGLGPKKAGQVWGRGLEVVA